MPGRGGPFRSNLLDKRGWSFHCANMNRHSKQLLVASSDSVRSLSPFPRPYPFHLTAKRGARLPAALWVCLSLAITAWAADPAPRLAVTCDHGDAVYAAGEPIRWHIEAKGESSSNLVEAAYALKQGGLTVLREGKVALSNGVATLETSLATPGTVLLELKAPASESNQTRALGGAVVSPASIRPSAERPADFDAFWHDKLAELSAVPANPHLTAAESGKPEVDYWQITMDNIRGSHIRGQLARPKTGAKFPAVLVVQWAGVYGLQKSWVADRAAAGWLALNINPHDLPIDEAPEFYEKQFKGALKDYWAIGNDDRDKSYFLRMYLSCYRAAQYLTERPDWDGKTLLVTGTSQGGLQTLMTAGFHPNVTAAIACVPAGCDMTGPQVGRSPGWPAWFYKTQDKDPAKVIVASRYYDVVNFASRIKCPVLTGVGLVDETCPPAGILAALNQVKAPKETVLLPHADHQGTGNTHQAFNDRAAAWLTALRQGKSIPPCPDSKAQLP
jgi:cephalosporin-C deacetylase